MAQANPSEAQLEENRKRSLMVVIINSLPEVPTFAITFRQLLSRVRTVDFPYYRNQLHSAFIDLSKGFVHKDNLYRIGVIAESNTCWFWSGYHARYYIMRTSIA